MGQDLFKYLPSEIINNILSRLPVRIIAISKCVCKSWLDLVESDEFAKSHLSRSSAALAVLTDEGNFLSRRCTVFELEDEIDVESSHDHNLKHLTNFNFPHRVTIRGSANGMLLLLKFWRHFYALYVCNPISHEYIELHCPEEFFIPRKATYGFGASKITGHHKVICIGDNSDCQVHTLGTGSWRRVEPPSSSFNYNSWFYGAFVNGNLHWLVSDSNDNDNAYACISRFDLETECFSTFSIPPFQDFVEMSALRDCVCLCDNVEDEIHIWLMKEYGDEKSWTKEYVINKNDEYGMFDHVSVYPIKVFKDGDILMVWSERFLFYYSNKKKTTQEIGDFDGWYGSLLLTLSFLSLKSFGMEDVISF